MDDQASKLPDASVAAWTRLIRVSQELLQKVEADLKAAGQPPLIWYDVLFELRLAGRSGLRPYELQQRLLLAQYNVSRLVDRMVRDGYVARNVCEDDKRGQHLSLTPSGKAQQRRMWPVYEAAIRRRFVVKLSASDIRSLTGILNRLKE